MTNLFVFIIAIFSAIALVYLIYTLMLTSEEKSNKKDLQISSKDILQQAELLYKQKKYDIIEKLAKKYLEFKPNHIELRQIFAKSLFNTDKLYDSIKQCLTILSIEPENKDIRLVLSRCYKKTNHISKAVDELKEILKDEPENISALKELGELYLKTNQKLSAVKIYQKLEELIESNIELSKIKTTLTDLFVELEDYPSAFDELNEILEIYPEDIETSKKLIELYIKVQNNERAIEACESLLLLNEKNSLGLWLLNNLINLYYITKDNEKTIEYAEKLLEHPFSDKVKTKTYIAKILIASGQEEAGLEILNDLSNQNIGNVEIKKMLADVYANKNDFFQATELYKVILDLVNPNEVQLVHTDMSNMFTRWAMFLFDKKEYTECFKVFTLAIQYDANNSTIYYKLGQVNQSIKNFNEAILQFKKAIELEPTNANFYIELANCYKSIENIYEEKNALLASIRYDDTNPYSHYNLALLYENQHDSQNAKKSLKRVIELDDTHLDAKYQYALILESQGNIEEAIHVYEGIAKQDINFKNVQYTLDMLTKADKS